MDSDGDGIKDNVISDVMYVKIVRFLECFKIHNGNIALNRTLMNHKALHHALLKYEQSRILEFEREIS